MQIYIKSFVVYFFAVLQCPSMDVVIGSDAVKMSRRATKNKIAVFRILAPKFV